MTMESYGWLWMTTGNYEGSGWLNVSMYGCKYMTLIHSYILTSIMVIKSQVIFFQNTANMVLFTEVKI